MNRFNLERTLQRKGYELVVGCDEAGRGALAGPVVAAAVIFDKPIREEWWQKIDDSKKLSPSSRGVTPCAGLTRKTHNAAPVARTGAGWTRSS